MDIKPGTLCMIRGIAPNLTGHTCNGKIVTVEGLKQLDVYTHSPVFEENGYKLNGCPRKYLFPFTDFSPEELANTQTKKEIVI